MKLQLIWCPSFWYGEWKGEGREEEEDGQRDGRGREEGGVYACSTCLVSLCSILM